MIASGQSGAAFVTGHEGRLGRSPGRHCRRGGRIGPGHRSRWGGPPNSSRWLSREEGRSRNAARSAYAIAHSPLTKTAFFASDPNLGRILAAIGYAGIVDLDVDRLRVWLDDVLVAEKTAGRPPIAKGWRPGDEASRNHDSGASWPRRGEGERLYLRPVLRLCQNQRRLPQLGCRNS